MVDIDGQTLAIGDRVVVSKGGRYHHFYVGVVTRFTPKRVEVVPTGPSSRYIDGYIEEGVKRLIHSDSCAKVFNQKGASEKCGLPQ